MQLVSTFANVYFKDVSAPLESICYSGPHACYIKENEIKQARQKSKIKRQKERIKKNKHKKNNQDKYRHSMQMIYTANNSRIVD